MHLNLGCMLTATCLPGTLSSFLTALYLDCLEEVASSVNKHCARRLMLLQHNEMIRFYFTDHFRRHGDVDLAALHPATERDLVTHCLASSFCLFELCAEVWLLLADPAALEPGTSLWHSLPVLVLITRPSSWVVPSWPATSGLAPYKPFYTCAHEAD